MDAILTLWLAVALAIAVFFCGYWAGATDMRERLKGDRP
jgi:hypothetical protein